MATTFSRFWCVITVTLHIEYDNQAGVSDADFLNRIEYWKQGIEAFWNDGGWVGYNGWPAEPSTWKCCDVRFEVDHRVRSGAWTPGYHRITIWPSLVNAEILITDVSQDMVGRWDYKEWNSTVAHEAGHLMALKDEYNQNNTSDVWHVLSRSDGRQCIMAVPSSYATVPTEGHVDAILGNVGANCWFICCFNIFKFLRLLELVKKAFRRPPPARLPHHPEVPWEDALPMERVFERGSSGRPSDFLHAIRDLQGRERLDAALVGEKLRSGALLERCIAAIVLADVEGADAEAALRDALSDDHESVRVHAARSLAARGLGDGVPVLLDALESDGVFVRHPPELVRSYANRVLETFWPHDADFDPHADAEERQAAVERWRIWCRLNEGRPPSLR